MTSQFIARGVRVWDADEARFLVDPDEYAPALDVAALEAVGAGWDDPTEPLPEFYADPIDELAVRRRVRALTPADLVEGRAA